MLLLVGYVIILAASIGTYAVFHPFASRPDKTWPAERFLAVATHLSQTGVEPVFIAGPPDEIGAFKNFQVHHNLSIRALKNLMAGAQIFLGNDSGPAHIAAAFGVPSVVLFGPSNPVTWAPWKTEAKVLTSPDSIQRITIQQVIAAADALKVRA